MPTMGLLLVAVTGALLLACADPTPPPLTPEEQQLVHDVVQLYTLRILRLVQPDSARALRERLELGLDDARLERQLQLLADDPRRGQLLLEAVHDSLEALKPRLFPSEQG